MAAPVGRHTIRTHYATKLDRYLAVVEAYDHRRVGDDDGVAAAFGRNFQATFDRRHRHRAVGQLLRNNRGVNRVRVRHRDGDIDEHVVWRLAEQPARVAPAKLRDASRHRPPHARRD